MGPCGTSQESPEVRKNIRDIIHDLPQAEGGKQQQQQQQQKKLLSLEWINKSSHWSPLNKTKC